MTWISADSVTLASRRIVRVGDTVRAEGHRLRGAWRVVYICVSKEDPNLDPLIDLSQPKSGHRRTVHASSILSVKRRAKETA